VDAVILTHCHADHDAGIFQKIMEETRISFFTTPTIMASFLRKYSSLSGLPESLVRSLFVFRPAVIGEPIKTHGGAIKFHYNLHAIPCVGFQASFGGKTIVYSGDTNYDPPRINAMYVLQSWSPVFRQILGGFRGYFS
jgi:Cft2 family RNA processing exonuclease